MRKPLFLLCIMAIMLCSCVHRARDRKIAEVITDSMLRGDFPYKYGRVQNVKLLCVHKITVRQRLNQDIAYYRYLQQLAGDSVLAKTVRMQAIKKELTALNDTLRAADWKEQFIDSVKVYMASLEKTGDQLKEQIDIAQAELAKTTEAADSLQAIKVDGDRFGGYHIKLAYASVKDGVRKTDTTESLVTEDWKCQNIMLKKVGF